MTVAAGRLNVPTGVDSYLFLDETGTSPYFNAKKLAEITASISAGTKPAISTTFGLAGVLMHRRDYVGFARALIAIKLKHFGTSAFTIHEYDVREAQRAPFSQLKNNPVLWQSFYADLDALIAGTDIRVIVATVDKLWMHQQYPQWQYNAYQYTLHVILERVINEKGFGKTCWLVAENRDAGLNKDLSQELLRLQSQGGTIDGKPTVDATEFSARVHPNIFFRTKQDRNAGLELADLCAGPITRWLHGLRTKHAMRDVLPLVTPKIRRSKTGIVRGYGVICLPGYPASCPV